MRLRSRPIRSPAAARCGAASDAGPSGSDGDADVRAGLVCRPRSKARDLSRRAFSKPIEFAGEESMPTRGLVDGEKALLKTVFGDTLPYDTQQITTNDSNTGGADNSVTYSGTPHFATAVWCYDFSVDGEAHWIFV